MENDEQPDLPVEEGSEDRTTRFRRNLEHLINCESRENGSDTPDFILAQYLTDCLEAFDRATVRRDQWYGREPEPVVIPENLTDPISTKPG